MFLRNKLKAIQYKTLSTLLKKANARGLLAESEQKALLAFKRACRKNYYKKILDKNSIKISSCHSINDFRKELPVIDKQTLFDPTAGLITDLLSELKSEQKPNILLSSGTSGQFAFGALNESAEPTNARATDILLNEYFQILKNKTLIINCFAQVKLPPLTAVCTDIGPKADSLHYCLKNLSVHFDQTIIIGDNLFIKNAIEDGVNIGINYSTLNVALILGGVYLPEALRTHLAQILTIDPKRINSSMGISEFGLNLFFESPQTIELRKQISLNSKLRQQICPHDFPPYLPMLFNYMPQNYFLEELNKEIVVTGLKSTELPLIRYNTHDVGHIIYFDELEMILKDHALTKLLPPFKSPLVLIYGRPQALTAQNKTFFVEDIMECLLSNYDLSLKSTGLFKVVPNESSIKISLQLKKGIINTPSLANRYKDQLTPSIPFPTTVELFTYAEFPFAMELDFQKKFIYK